MNQDAAAIENSALDLADKSKTSQINENTEAEPCANCGVALNGQFCHSCGQSSKSMIKFFGEVIKELLDDTLGYDSRLKHSIIPLLFKPGRITLDYIKGKRSHYVLPFKLYLIISVLFILVIKNVVNTNHLTINNGVTHTEETEIKEAAKKEIDHILKSDDGTIKEKLITNSNKVDDSRDYKAEVETDHFNLLDEIKRDLNDDLKGVEVGDSDGFSLCNKDNHNVKIQWDSNKKILTGLDNLSDSWCKTFVKVINPKLSVWIDKPEKLVDAIIELLPFMMFIILPIFAIFMKIFYLFSKRFYTEHLVFLLHNHSFIYFVLMMQVGLNLSEDTLKPIDHWFAQSIESLVSLLSLLLGFWLFIYVFLAMKRFYRQGWMATIFKTMSLGFIYTTMLTFGFMIALAVGAYQA